MSKTQNRGRLRVRYRPVTAISVASIRQMFALHLQHDPHASLDDFIRGLCAKSGAVLATRAGSDKVLGYTLVSITHMVFDGQRVTGVFSEPGLRDITCSAPDVTDDWGDEMGEALFHELMRMHVAHPLTRLVWLTRADDATGACQLRAHCRQAQVLPGQQTEDASARLAQAFGRRLFPQASERRRPALLMGDVDTLGIMVCLTTRPWRWFRRNILRNYRAVEAQAARQTSITPQQAAWQDSDALDALERGETS